MSIGQVRQWKRASAGISRRPGHGFEAVVPNPKFKLLDQVKEVMRLRPYSIRTEECYCTHSLHSSPPRSPDGTSGQQILDAHGEFADAHAGGVMDGVGNRSGGAGQADFADAARAKRVDLHV